MILYRKETKGGFRLIKRRPPERLNNMKTIIKYNKKNNTLKVTNQKHYFNSEGAYLETTEKKYSLNENVFSIYSLDDEKHGIKKATQILNLQGFDLVKVTIGDTYNPEMKKYHFRKEDGETVTLFYINYKYRGLTTYPHFK
jgi:Zn-dependent oligopeptidase